MTIICDAELHGQNFAAYNGDCIAIASQFPDSSIDFSIYSPPFGDLFTYSPSSADMGNSSGDGEFFTHYEFLIEQLARITKPGRLNAVHCTDLPFRKWKDGKIGVKDFSGQIIRAYERHGFILHSRITIWRDPVVEMTRTKALGLLYKQLQKDSSMSRAGLPDYLLVFRREGENAAPISHSPADFPVSQWQQWASPVWMDIDQTNTLNIKQAREDKDEKHVCPLQLDLIERALVLWSNPKDVVFSPFMGIGSEGYVALKLRRKFIGTELKEGYWRQACEHMQAIEAEGENIMDALVA